MTRLFTVRFVDSFGQSPDVEITVAAESARDALHQAWEKRPGPLWSAIIEKPERVEFHPVAEPGEPRPEPDRSWRVRRSLGRRGGRR